MPVPWPPVEPAPTRWRFAPERADPGDDLLAAGADLEPGTLLAAYRSGVFPMGLGRLGRGPMGWWSPDPRGVLLPGGMHVSRSLARAVRRCQIRVDTAFTEVITACADDRRDGRWITPEVIDAYTRLHELGWAHSVETWRDGELVGGLYGVLVGGLFAGESMFHRQRDASKVALVGLAQRFFDSGGSERIIDVQWQTPHLASLGVVTMPRPDYLRALARVVDERSVRLA